MQGKIHLKNIKVKALVGCRSHERGLKQPLILDLVLGVPLKKLLHEDHLESTVDYSKVPPFIEKFIHNSSYHLLERLGVELAHQIADHFSLLSIHLIIQKPFALKDLADISFEYFHKT